MRYVSTLASAVLIMTVAPELAMAQPVDPHADHHRVDKAPAQDGRDHETGPDSSDGKCPMMTDPGAGAAGEAGHKHHAETGAAKVTKSRPPMMDDCMSPPNKHRVVPSPGEQPSAQG